MFNRPISKQDRVPTIDDADHKGRVKVWVGDKWALVDYHTAATFQGVDFWMHNRKEVLPCQLSHTA